MRVPVLHPCSLQAETPATPMHLAWAAPVDAEPFTTAEGSLDVAPVRRAVDDHLD
jgi:hypothetical protein